MVCGKNIHPGKMYAKITSLEKISRGKIYQAVWKKYPDITK
jgi:hypothetical protein